MSIFLDNQEEIADLANLVGGTEYDGTFEAQEENVGLFTWTDADDNTVGTGIIHIYDGDGVIWAHLEFAPEAQRQGIMTRITEVFPPFWLSKGLTRSIVPCPTTDAIRNGLTQLGYQQSDQGFWYALLEDLVAYHES